MKPSTRHNLIFFTVLVFAIAFGVVLLPQPGTGDMKEWVHWCQLAVKFGPVEAYNRTLNYYPPGSTTILWLTSNVLGARVVAVKASILFFWAFYALVCGYLWRRLSVRDLRIVLIAAFNPAIFIGAQCLAYLDVYFAALLLLSLWALLQNRWMLLSGVCFAAALMIKWQPIIILPLIPVFLLSRALKREIAWRPALSWCTGFAASAGVLLLFYMSQGGSIAAIWKSLAGSTHTAFVSGFGMNLDWLITYALHVIDPGKYKPLAGGLCEPVYADIRWIRRLDMALLVPVYLFFAVVMARSGRFALCAAGGGYAYFCLAYGVHENHLFIAVIVTTAWLLSEPDSRVARWVFGVSSVLHLANLTLIYGLTGNQNVPRVVGGVDISLLLAAAHIGALLWLLVLSARGDRTEVKRASSH